MGKISLPCPRFLYLSYHKSGEKSRLVIFGKGGIIGLYGGDGMEDFYGLMPLSHGREQLMAALQGCNALSTRYGLTLSRADMRMLAEKQMEALRSAGRIEFGCGPYEKLVYALCDSPYLTQTDYAETLAELCVLFYQFKSESGERWSDDELIGLMKWLYDGECQGSLDLVGDRLWQTLHTHPDTENFAEEEEPFDEE